jgi:hypothetical protein
MLPGTRFCAHCGRPAGAAGPGAPAAVVPGGWLTPWRVAGLLVAGAAIAMVWAISRGPGSPAPVAPVAPAAPDISNLTPREQFSRLADRVESAMESGDTGTVVRFFPMVEAAYDNLPASGRDIDARFHISLLRSRIGHFAAGLAQVDTIVATAPTHLFAYYLKSIIADFQHDTTAAKRARRDFRKHFATEMATNRPEYQMHRQMLENFLATIPAETKP